MAIAGVRVSPPSRLPPLICSIFQAVLHQLATHTMPLSFFATHYGSLTDDFAYHPNIRNMHMSTLVDDEKREVGPCFDDWDQLITPNSCSSSFCTSLSRALLRVHLVRTLLTWLVSVDFARQFKERLEGKQKKSASSRLPLVAQADFVYLYRLATGATEMPEDPVRQIEVLKRMKEIAKCYI
jgi:DNA mismatch repair protein MSH6